MSTPEARAFLRCTVRGCARPLALGARVARCGGGHSFDRARSGYWNLLQPQDRRAAAPGDRPEAVAARRRLFARGFQHALLQALGGPLGACRAGAAVLDVGCGEGSLLGTLAARRGWNAHGLDLSSAAASLAARTFPDATWVVANADRGLPYLDRVFDAVLSITARRPVGELHRVLDPAGLLLVAVPADDDLAELREAVLGDAPALDAGAVEAELVPRFTVVERLTVRQTVRADPADLADLLLATYRGQRRSAAARLPDAATEVTVAHRLLVLRPRPADG